MLLPTIKKKFEKKILIIKLGIIYKLLEGNGGSSKTKTEKKFEKSSKKSFKKVRKKV
jgi:hypothetical protein